MAYLGQAPINGFHAKQTLTGDGSTVTYDLDQTVATETSIIVSVGGVLQEPSVAYDLAEGGTKITFTEAPASTDRVYIHYLGKAIVQNTLDIAGVEFILDADNDTSLTADTDDEIDIKVGGTDINTIKSTGFHNLDSIKYVAGTGDDLEIYHDGTNSLIANKTGALKLATETSGIAVTIGHSTSEVTVADNLTVAGDMTVTGTASFADTNLTNIGSIALDTITNDGTDITLDSSGDIILDAGGDTIFLKDSGTTFGSLDNTSGNLIIKSGTTTAATFSGANVTLAGTVGSGAITSTGIVTGTGFTAGSAVLAEAELELLDGLTAGTAIASKVVTTDANIDTTGQRNLTISGELDAATGDFSGDVDIDGTLEADAITVNGTALASVIAGTTVNLATLASTVTITDNENTDENNAIIFTAGGDVDGGSLGLESDGDLTYNPSTGTLNVTNISVSGTQTIVNSVTMNASNAVIFEGATADAHETTLTTIDATGDRTISLPNVSGTLPVLAAASATAITSTPEELNLLDGVSGLVQADLTKLAAIDATAAEINLIDGGTSTGTTAVADADGIITNDGGTMRLTTAATFKTYFQEGISTAYDDLTAGDAAVLITTSSGNITIDAAADDSDIIFKGTDGGADTTFLTIDGSAAGTATFNSNVIGTSFNSIPFFSGDTGSIYTHDVSGTDSSATNNTAYGLTALDAITTGDNNTAIGHGALGANNTGSENTAIGYNALTANTSGTPNIAVGNYALMANTTGTSNVALGLSALKENTTASYNIGIGQNAGRENTTGTRNIAIGVSAYDASDTENDNLAIGYEAMTTNTAGGVYNIAVGNYSLDALTSGDGNVGVGMETLSATNTGRYNTAVGYRTLYTNTSGDTNVAVGKESLYYNTTGDDNIALGNQALTSNTTGASNTAIGTNALTANTTADDNVAIGHNTLSANTTGTRNIAIGRAAYYGSDTEKR